MVKKDFVASVKEKTADYKFTNDEINAMLTAVSDTLMEVIRAEDSYKFESIGTFSGKFVPAHEARNPLAGTTIQVPDKHGYPVFKFSSTAKKCD